jgi:peptide/nickel transport system permease protein
MIAYILRRLGLILVTMLVASIIIFGVTQLLPGDVAQVVLGQFATPQAVENLREELGLNRPHIIQYIDWLTGFITGDWGDSMVSRMEVRPMVMGRLRNSIMLASVSLALYVPLGILLGIIAALKEDRPVDQAISSVSMAFVGLPEFVTGLLLISFLAISANLLPANSSIEPNSSFREAFPFLILPAITVSLTSLGYVARMTRASTIDVLRSDYIRAADLKGLPRSQVLIKHVLRNSLLPTVTVVAMGIGWLIGGLIVTESVFGYPGLGRLLVFGIQRRDLTIIQATSMVIVAIYSLANLAADILYGILNPRIRVGG